jgi:hypothetical protein
MKVGMTPRYILQLGHTESDSNTEPRHFGQGRLGGGCLRGDGFDLSISPKIAITPDSETVRLDVASERLDPAGRDSEAVGAKTNSVLHFGHFTRLPISSVPPRSRCPDGQNRVIFAFVLGFMRPSISCWSPEILSVAICCSNSTLSVLGGFAEKTGRKIFPIMQGISSPLREDL